MASKEQVNRLLALVPYLQARPAADLRETAAVFGVSSAQLVSDLKVLWYCGLPDGLPGDLIEVDIDGLEDGTIRLSNADYLDRPLRFTPDEALSLIVAVQAVRDLAGADLSDAVESALQKLSLAAGNLPTAPVDLTTATGPAALRQLLTEAIGARRVVRLDYDGGARGHTTHPLVEPGRLSMRDGFAYLDAWSLDRSDWRTYRLDRIADAEVLAQECLSRGAPPVFDAGWLDNRLDAVTVTLVLAESARWITEYIPVLASLETEAGLQIQVRVADPAWLRSQLLRLGAGVLRVEPVEAADSARAAAREALRHYR